MFLHQYLSPANMGPAVPYLTVAYFKSVYKIFPAIATGTSSWNYSIFHAWSILPYKLIYFPSDKRLQKISWWHLSLKHGISNDSLFHGIVNATIKSDIVFVRSKMSKISLRDISLKNGITNDSLFHGIVNAAVKMF